MSTDFTIEYHFAYLRILNAPDFELTAGTAAELLSALTAACAMSGCKRVLWEGKIAARRLSTMQVFDSARKVAKVTPGIKLACFFEGYVPDKLSLFFKTAARNRGAHIEFFSTRQEALEWLAVNPATSINHQLTA